MPVQFLPSGDSAIVVQFGDEINRAVSDRVLRLHAALERARLAGVIETVPTFRSLLVHYDPVRACSADLTREIGKLVDLDEELEQRQRTWRIPVCYDEDFAPDLQGVADRVGLTREDVVELHGSTRYHTYMVGFVPGFPYMGDLPPALVLPRRQDPRVRVPPGAVAIATSLTAIYPLESPGGWHLIGTTPVKIFDTAWQSPALLAPGDDVDFFPVSPAEFEEIRTASDAGSYRLQSVEVST